MTERERPSFWAVIPASVRYDAGLSAGAKLLYGEISALADRRGYCFASNAYFAAVFSTTDRTVRRTIAELSAHGYITVEVVRDTETNEVQSRRIGLGRIEACGSVPAWADAEADAHSEASDGEAECPDPSGQKCPDPSGQKCPVEQFKYINNIPPIVPQGEADNIVQPARGRGKTEAKWKPERFEAFWRFYPVAACPSQSKARAREAWDRLRPEDKLIADMGVFLRRLMTTGLWAKGVGIPYASTFLNRVRTEGLPTLPDADATDAPPPPEEPKGAYRL